MTTDSSIPESDLNILIRSMAPVIRDGEYVFVDGEGTGGEVLAMVREPEGPSCVMARADADRLGLSYDFVAGWITLHVHSALHAVGLTAHVATALSAAGISCNVIAGKHHDHLLVPYDETQRALAVLVASSSSH